MNYKYFFFLALLFITAGAQSQKLSLEQCRTMALDYNKKIKAASFEIEAARNAEASAKANRLPAVDASVMGLHVGKPLSTLLPSVIANGSVNVSQPIYAGGKIRLGIDASQKAVELYEAQKKMTTAEVLLNVEKAYWQVIQVKEKVKVAEEYKKMLEALRTDLANAFEAGLIYKNDLLKAEVSLNEIELNLTKARDGVLLAKLNLAQAIGQPGNTEIETDDTVDNAYEKVVMDSIFQQAYNRPEIEVLNKAIEIQSLQQKIIKADLKPTIAISASGFGAAGKQINFTNAENYMFSYYGIASISIPIFDWGKTLKKAKEQSFKIEAQKVQLEETKELIGLEVQHAYLSLTESVKGIELSKLSLTQAEENLRLTNDRFKAGTIVGKDLLEAQAIWQQARNGVIDAVINYKIALASYKKAVGKLL